MRGEEKCQVPFSPYRDVMNLKHRLLDWRRAEPGKQAAVGILARCFSPASRLSSFWEYRGTWWRRSGASSISD